MSDDLAQLPVAPIGGSLKLWMGWAASGFATVAAGALAKMIGQKASANRAHRRNAVQAQAEALEKRMVNLEDRAARAITKGDFEMKMNSVLEAIHETKAEIKSDVRDLAIRLDAHIDHHAS